MTMIEERRLITVLFVDLSGFTALSQQLDPEEVREAVSICFEQLNPIIIQHGGIIHDYGGDLVIALFGLPQTHEDDPERAIKASFAMMGCLPDINRVIQNRMTVKTEIGLHVGISSGTVLIGEIGSPEKSELTVVGEVVNLASRLKDTAKSGEILVSESVYRFTRYLFEYEKLPPTTLKGIEGEVKVFKPIKLREQPEPKRGIKGLISPLVGRDRELDLLKQRLDAAYRGQGGVAFITGDAGIGKTRIFNELKSFALSSGNYTPVPFFLESRCFAYSEKVAYDSFLQFLKKNIFGISERDSIPEIHEKLIKFGAALLTGDYREIIPYIGHFLSVRFDDELNEKIKYLDPKDLKIQFFVSVKKLLSAVAKQQPAILVIEDFHWIDSASLELLEFIFDAPEISSILLICLTRIEKDTESDRVKERLKKKLGDKFSEITLSPLEDNAARQLVDNLLQVSGVTETFKQRILVDVAGNPFYLEEILRSMIDEGLLVFESGYWCLALDVTEITIPDTIKILIASRLDRLENDAKIVLQQASVIGRFFDVVILERLCGLDSLVLSLQLAILEEFQFIIRDVTDAGLRYQFRHPLIHEVAYSGILKKKRGELHRQTARVIERIYFDRLDDYTDMLAYQYANSDDSERALVWLTKAGQRAKGRYANDEAIKYFEEIVRITKKGMKTRSEELVAALESLGDVHNHQGEYDRAIRYFESMYTNTGDRIIKLRAMRKQADAYFNKSKYNNALKILEEAEQTLTGDTIEEIIEKAEIQLLKCETYRMKGEMAKALLAGEAGLKLISDLGVDNIETKKVRAKGFIKLGAIFSIKAEYDRAIEYFQNCLKLAIEAGDKKMIGHANGNLGIGFYYKHEYDKAIELYQKYLTISEEIGDKQGIGKASNNLGLLYRHIHEDDKAIQLFEKYLSISKEIGDQQGVGTACGNMGPIYYIREEYDKAAELFQTQLRISEKTGDKRGIGTASYNLGYLYYELKDYSKAIEFFMKDLKIAEELGDKRGTGLTRSTLGRAYLEMGELARAEEYLLQSEKLLKGIGSKNELIDNYVRLAELTLKKGVPVKQALNYVDKALKIANEIDAKVFIADCYFTYGTIFHATRDHPKAEDNLLKAIELIEELNLPKKLRRVYREYALVLEEMGNKEKAKIYFNKASK